VKHRIFFQPEFDRYVLLTADVLTHMYSHAQRKWWQKEAGGELFACDPDSPGLVIVAAIGPHSADQRGRHAFNPDILAATRARMTQFQCGCHAVGMWHTHPEPQPSPSHLDRQTTMDYLKAFEGDRKLYLMVIVGNQGTLPGITVWSAQQGGWAQWLEQQ
jgi:integrative and conjugative element protein (TIGR02256 family)